MLKIYRRTFSWYIKYDAKNILVNSHSNFVIEEESEAINARNECNAYTDEAVQKYLGSVDVRNTRRGRSMCYRVWPEAVVIKEWKHPDAKLVTTITYKEMSCSMKELMSLDANKVIAYLKQEGLGLDNFANIC